MKPFSRLFGLLLLAALPAWAAAADATSPAVGGGDVVAFVSIRSGDPHIHLLSGGVDRPITSGPGVHTSPALSHDGKVAYLKSIGGLTRLHVTDAGGQNPRRLNSGDRYEVGASWSPDGRSIAYYSADATKPGMELHITDLVTGAVAVVGADGRDKGPQAPTWSSDGKRLAFLGHDAKGQRQAHVVERDGSGLKDVSGAFSTRHKAAPQISPDGSRVVFVADARERRPIVVVELASGKTTELTREPDAAYELARWSPDGRQLVVVRTPDKMLENVRNDIFVVNADGTGARNVSNHPAEDFDPHWAANGRAIVFASLRGGTSQLYRVDLVNGRTEALSRGHRSHDMDHVVAAAPK